jgi:hypothetical protein
MTENPQLSPVELRQAEVAQYQANIALYTAIADALPSEYPDHLVQFKNSADKHSDIAKVEDLADVELLSDLWAHDAAKAAIRAETVEMRKSMAILNVLLAE